MQPEQPEATSRVRWAEAALLAAVMIAALVPRILTLDAVSLTFGVGGLRQWDGDSAYHLKRILDTMARFPAMIRWDPAMTWPDGAACPWPDGYDYLAAVWALVAGLGDLQRGTLALMLFTPILALLGVWAGFDVARLVIPEGPAKPTAVAAAALLTAFAPASLFLSSVGFLDHHIAELVVALVLSGWALRRYPGPASTWSDAPVRWEVAGAVAATVSLWTFAGGILYVALAGVVVGVAVLVDERPRLVGSGAPALAAAALASALLSLPAVAAHGRLLSYQLPSLLQPLLVAFAALGLAAAVLAGRVARRFPARVAVVLALVVAVALAAAAFAGAAGALREVQAGLAGWLLRKDPWIATIQEFQPLGGTQQWFLLELFWSFGSIGVGAPLILLAGAWVVVRTAPGRGLAFVALTAAFVALTLNQVRFGRVGVPLLMIHLAAVLTAFAQRRRRVQHVWAARLFPAAVAVVLLFADPVLRPVGKHLPGMPPYTDVALQIGLEARGDTSQGVLTQWDQGHLVTYLSGLPTVTNGFGTYVGESVFREAEGVFGKGPAELDDLLARRRVRFVLAGAMNSPLAAAVPGRLPFVRAQDARRGILDLDYMKAFGNAPLLIGGSGIPGAGVHHLEHLLPFAASPLRPPGLAFPLPAMWAYERVPGARLVGTAPPRARIVATLEFKEWTFTHTWRAWGDAGADGRFELVVPLPSGFLRPTISSAPRWEVSAGDGPPVAVEVPEQAVRTGQAVRVGPLRASDGAAVRPGVPAAGPRTRGDEDRVPAAATAAAPP